MKMDDLVLDCIGALQPRAYGVTIHERLQEEYRKFASLGAVYVAIDRLEDDGLVTSHYGPLPSDAERGGIPRRLCFLTGSGERRRAELRHEGLGDALPAATYGVTNA